MAYSNLPAIRSNNALAEGFPVLASSHVRKLLADPERAEVNRRVLQRARELALDIDRLEPLTHVPHEGKIIAHLDPKRRVVLLLASSWPGWPGVTDDLIEALFPFCSPISFD